MRKFNEELYDELKARGYGENRIANELGFPNVATFRLYRSRKDDKEFWEKAEKAYEFVRDGNYILYPNRSNFAGGNNKYYGILLVLEYEGFIVQSILDRETRERCYVIHDHSPLSKFAIQKMAVPLTDVIADK